MDQQELQREVLQEKNQSSLQQNQLLCQSKSQQNQNFQGRMQLGDLTNTPSSQFTQRLSQLNSNLKSQGKYMLGGCQTPQNLEISRKTENDLEKENIYQQLQFSNDVCKSVDLKAQLQSQTGLIESCLTFNGNNNENENENDIAFLTQAMQPDKIFDLPLALIKVQKAFQQSNQNVLKLKDSLEQVLRREQNLQEEYENLKRQKQLDDLYYEEEIFRSKNQLKVQLQEFNYSIIDLQNQIQNKDKQISKLRQDFERLQNNEQNLNEQLNLWENKGQINEKSNVALEMQLKRKEEDIKELKEQFKMLERAEEISSKQIEKLTSKYKNEVKVLNKQIQELNILNEVLQKDLDCTKKEKKIAQESEERLMNELHQLRYTLKEDIEKKYIDLLECNKSREQEVEELKTSLNQKNYKIIELTKKMDSLQLQKQDLQNDLFTSNQQQKQTKIKMKEALDLQREKYENKMKDIEEEVTKITINRYKSELEQKQKLLKVSKKYDEQVKELTQVIGYVANILDIKQLPKYIVQNLDEVISEIKISKEMQVFLQEFHLKIKNCNKSQINQEVNLHNDVKYEKLLKAYQNELYLRRQLHNKLQELRGNIRVLCRVRPFSRIDSKKNKSKSSILKNLSSSKIVIQNEQGTKQNKFQFDRIFEPSPSQDEISDEVSQLVLSSLDGFNVCIMAYGQTGSGKTYTMIGDDDNPGLYFSSVDCLIENIQSRKNVFDYELGVSFVEIYNENLIDLLSKKSQQSIKKVNLREGSDGQTNGDQTIKIVKSKNQILAALREACLNRTVGVTNYNEQSSRSHFIFTIFVNGRNKKTNQVFRGRLNLIDLAGSERILKSKAQDERIKEALNINQSLTTLGKVFLALLNKSSHVPYRDSKLTHYLKDSLGGESKTMLVIQINPCTQDYGESLSSLNFGQRVQQIEKGMIRATIESPTKYLRPSKIMKRCKSSNNRSARRRMSDEFQIEPDKGIFSQYSQNQSQFDISCDYD